MSNSRLFVYGTLKTGQRNHGVLEQFITAGKAAFKGVAMTAQPQYLMVEFNSRSSPGKKSPGVYTAEKLGREGGYILGEIYEVDGETLNALDKLEGHGVNYRREKIRMDDGTLAETYLKMVDNKDYQLLSPHIDLQPSGNRTSTRDDCFVWNDQPTPAG